MEDQNGSCNVTCGAVLSIGTYHHHSASLPATSRARNVTLVTPSSETSTGLVYSSSANVWAPVASTVGYPDATPDCESLHSVTLRLQFWLVQPVGPFVTPRKGGVLSK